MLRRKRSLFCEMLGVYLLRRQVRLRATSNAIHNISWEIDTALRCYAAHTHASLDVIPLSARLHSVWYWWVQQHPDEIAQAQAVVTLKSANQVSRSSRSHYFAYKMLPLSISLAESHRRRGSFPRVSPHLALAVECLHHFIGQRPLLGAKQNSTSQVDRHDKKVWNKAWVNMATL